MSQDSLLDQHLDEYRIEKLLGRGGMARVYQGVDVNLQRKVAIKVIDTPYRTDTDYLMRFKREAQAIAQLEHPHVVRLYRYGERDGLLYMAMQYVEGVDLQAVINSYQATGEFIEPENISQIFRNVCEALDYIHQHGVIHRDIKPSNIMINAKDQAILADFGLALLIDVGTRGEIFGTPDYIAPEQAISSAKAVPQSDIYAVGTILYETLVGQLPFSAENPLDLAMKHVIETPPPPRELRPEISVELEAVILKAMAKEPADRYQTGSELADALDHALSLEDGELDMPPPATASTSMLHRVQSKEGMLSLPLVPAAVSPAPGHEQHEPPAEESRPGGSSSKPSSSTPQLPVILGAGAFLWVGLMLAALCIVVGGIWAFGRGQGEEGDDNQSVAIATRTLPSLTLDERRTVLPSPTQEEMIGGPSKAKATTEAETHPSSPTEAVPTVAPAPAREVSYTLVIMTNKKDSLVIVNRSDVPFPLAALSLEGENGTTLLGTAWELDILQPDECVYAVKDKGEPKLPGIECQTVRERLPREGSQRFWDKTFDIYFDGEKVDTCEKEDGEDGCWVVIGDDD